MSTLPRRRIGLVYPFSNLDSVPSLVSAAVLLAEHGYAVDLLVAPGERHCAPRFDHPLIDVLPLPACLSRLPATPAGPPDPLDLRQRHASVPYRCLVGVDPDGLLLAADIRECIPVPLVYFSLELLLSHEIRTPHAWTLKARERRLSREAAWVIIQDDERAELLIRDNGLADERVLRVPNAPLGAGQVRRSDYLRTRHQLPPETRIILHAGSLQPWSGGAEMVRATQDWPDDWVLICHTRARPSGTADAYLEELRRHADPRRVRFSTEPLPRQDYPALVQSADVLLAYYFTLPDSVYTQDNLRVLGRSSGKVAHALQAGVPLVVNDHATLRDLVGTYGCGEWVTDPLANRAAIERVLSRRAHYSENALRCFNQEFDFRGRFARVLACLDTLGGQAVAPVRTKSSPQ